MQQDPFTNNSYTPNPVDTKARTNRIITLTIVTILSLTVVGLAIYGFVSSGTKDDATKAATDAAREQTPDAQVTDTVVADGFAMAIVSDPHANSQANAGNMTLFTVDDNGKMKQIANGSDFSPIDLLGFGVPLETQAKLARKSVSEIRFALASSCGQTNGMEPGYLGFGGTFQPDNWQIDATTLTNLQQALSSSISSSNSKLTANDRVVCVNVTRDNSDAKTDLTSYISTFTVEADFITANGKVSNHTITFAVGPKNYQKYTIDGKQI